MILEIIINGLFLLALLCALVTVVRFGSRIEHRAFAIGIALAFLLAIVSHLEAIGVFHLSPAQYLVCGRLILLVWPSAFMFLDVDPIVEYSVQRLLLYVISLLVNGVLYAGITAGVRKIWTMAKGARPSV